MYVEEQRDLSVRGEDHTRMKEVLLERSGFQAGEATCVNHNVVDKEQ